MASFTETVLGEMDMPLRTSEKQFGIGKTAIPEKRVFDSYVYSFCLPDLTAATLGESSRNNLRFIALA